MLQHLRPAPIMLLAFTLLTGVAYPLAVTGIALGHDAGRRRSAASSRRTARSSARA